MEGEPEYAAHPYPMDLKVWLCGICHHVYDEEEEAEECCPDFKVGDIEGERDWWAEEILTPLGGIRPSKNTMWMCSQCGEDAHYYLEDEEVRIWDDYTFYCQECADSFSVEEDEDCSILGHLSIERYPRCEVCKKCDCDDKEHYQFWDTRVCDYCPTVTSNETDGGGLCAGCGGWACGGCSFMLDDGIYCHRHWEETRHQGKDR